MTKRAPPVIVRKGVLITHRYVGLFLALFLILLGITGSLLAFNTELERAISPQLFATEDAGRQRLSLAALAEHAETLAPQARLAYLIVYPGQVMARMQGQESAEGETAIIDFDQIFLDPRTGKELGRRRYGDLSQGVINLMPFIYLLHRELALGPAGMWTLGILSLVWTIDCIAAVYLTVPLGLLSFWRRWKRSWQIKWPSGPFVLNFDVHRAGSLWNWPMLLVFGWSGVMMDLGPVYDQITGSLFDYRSIAERIGALSQPSETPPRLNWKEAEIVGEKLLQQQAAQRGFQVGASDSLAYIRAYGVYSYGARSSLDVRGRTSETAVWFDADSGELRTLLLPTGEHTGNTISTWLWALHFADIADCLPYRVFVCVLGLVLTCLSGTGVYIWLHKRRARLPRRATS